MSVPTIPKPGVKVIQDFQTVSPTVATPTMPACILGAGFQIVEAVDDTGALNSEALINTPAKLFFPFVAATYTGLSTTTFQFSVNNGPTVTVTFDAGAAGADITPAEAQADFVAAAIPGIVAKTETSGGLTRLVIETVATGQFASLQVVGGTSVPAPVSTLAAGLTSIGQDNYSNFYALQANLADYPDPRSNLDELTIDYTTVRAFLDLGAGNFREVLRTESLLQGATSAVTVVNDGDGDNLSPFVQFASADFTATPAAAVGTGTVDLSGITYGGAGPFATGLQLILSIGGGDPQTITLDATIVDETALVAAINAPFVGTPASLTGGNLLVLTSTLANGGVESSVRVDPNSTALTTLGLDTVGGPFETADVIFGAPFVPTIGDRVVVDGVTVGSITEVASGGNVDRLRLDTELLLTFTGAQWYIVATGLENGPSTATRPSSDLQVDEDSGAIIIKHHLIHDAAGVPTAAARNTYLGYNALRRDISSEGEGFSLLRYGGLSALEADLAPIDTQSPLSLGMYFAMLNAPGLEVTGVGVAETSATEAEGTLDAFTAGFEFLESKDVYAIAPMTHNINVARIGQAHVVEMSKKENGGERVMFFNPDRPTRNANTILASGAEANSSGSSSIVDTGVANLPALMAAAGLGAGPYTIADNVFLELESDTNKYLVLSVSGSLVTVSTGALAGNDDAFYAEPSSPAFATAIVDRPFSIGVRGDVLANLTEEAIAYAEIARGFLERRVIVTTPDTAVSEIDGLEQRIEGYYLNAALAGLTSSKAPQDPMTNVALTGFSGLVGATDRYGETQYRIMDGGGLWSMVQEKANSPITTRHQLSTDMSSIEKREFSITTAVDFAAKFFRQGLRNFIGRFNVTGNVQDAVSITLDGLGAFLVSQGVLSRVAVNRVIQLESAPDNMEIDVTLGVFYPLNEVQLRLII